MLSAFCDDFCPFFAVPLVAGAAVQISEAQTFGVCRCARDSESERGRERERESRARPGKPVQCLVGGPAVASDDERPRLRGIRLALAAALRFIEVGPDRLLALVPFEANASLSEPLECRQTKRLLIAWPDLWPGSATLFAGRAPSAAAAARAQC